MTEQIEMPHRTWMRGRLIFIDCSTVRPTRVTKRMRLPSALTSSNTNIHTAQHTYSSTHTLSTTHALNNSQTRHYTIQQHSHIQLHTTQLSMTRSDNMQLTTYFSNVQYSSTV